jgi:hypothetical protein
VGTASPALALWQESVHVGAKQVMQVARQVRRHIQGRQQRRQCAAALLASCCCCYWSVQLCLLLLLPWEVGACRSDGE